MAKNIKWMKVDSVTGISHMVAKSENGLMDPDLSGLTSGGFDWNDFEYGTCDDSVTADPSNFIIELTDEQWISDIQEKANYQLGCWKADIYKAEKDLRNEHLGTYGESAYAAGAGYKYDAAVELSGNQVADVRRIPFRAAGAMSLFFGIQSKKYLVARIGIDTAENEPLKVR